MPLARIDLQEGQSADYRRALADGVYQAMVETAGVPESDQFAVVNERTPENLVYNPDYLGIERSEDVVFVQLTFNSGRSLEQKRALYARIVELFEDDPGVRPEDVLINLVETGAENWSFGNGDVSYDPESEDGRNEGLTQCSTLVHDQDPCSSQRTECQQSASERLEAHWLEKPPYSSERVSLDSLRRLRRSFHPRCGYAPDSTNSVFPQAEHSVGGSYW